MNQYAVFRAPDVTQEEEDKAINLKLASSQGEEVFFKIKYATKLFKLQSAFANKIGKDIRSLRFLYNGEQFDDENTPASLEMEDNAVIEVMVQHLASKYVDIIMYPKYAHPILSESPVHISSIILSGLICTVWYSMELLFRKGGTGGMQ